MNDILQEVAYVLSLKLNFSSSCLLCLESTRLPDPRLYFYFTQTVVITVVK